MAKEQVVKRVTISDGAIRMLRVHWYDDVYGLYVQRLNQDGSVNAGWVYTTQARADRKFKELKKELK